jgi:hypothetical protein
VVARSTGPNRPNCEFQVPLRSFAVTAWKLAKTSHRTLARTHLVASPRQRPASHFRPHPALSKEIVNGCHPPPTVLPTFGTLWLLPISKNEIEAEKDAGLMPLRRSRPNRRECWTVWQKRSSKKRSRNGDYGTGVYMREGTTSRLMVATGVPKGGVWGFQTPSEIIPKFWQSRAEFPVPWKIYLKNLIRIQVSPTCKFGGTLVHEGNRR